MKMNASTSIWFNLVFIFDVHCHLPPTSKEYLAVVATIKLFAI
jgi:hypothetical protein